MKFIFFFFIKSVETYCTVFFFLIVGLFPPRPLSHPDLCRANRVFIWRRVLRKQDLCMAYFTTFAVCASYCVFHFPSQHERLVTALPHPQRPALSNPAKAPSFHLNWGSLCLLRVLHSTLDTHKEPVIERHKQASILVVKLVWALQLYLSTFLSLYKAGACKNAFFIPGIF